jgi:hypothetical protein
VSRRPMLSELYELRIQARAAAAGADFDAFVDTEERDAVHDAAADYRELARDLDAVFEHELAAQLAIETAGARDELAALLAARQPAGVA